MKTTYTTHLSRILPALALLAIAAVPAHAQTNSQTWDGGGGDNNWSTAANWTNDTVPINQFVDFAGTTQTSTNNDIAAGKYIYEMRLKNTTAGQSFTVGGNQVFVHNAVRAYAVGSGNITDVINLDMTTLNGNWIIDSNHNVQMNGVVISGPVNKSGAGTLTLAGANTYTGATTVSAGTLKVTNSSKTPSYDIASGATLELSASPTANVAINGAGTFTVTGPISAGAIGFTTSMDSGAYIDIQNGRSLVFNGGGDPWTGNKADVNVDGWLYGAANSFEIDALTGGASGLLQMGSGTINLGVDNGTGGVFDGDIRRSYADAHLNKQGTGTQTLNGELNLGSTGTVTVSEGTLIFNGTSSGSNATGSWTVEDGATLSGSGTLSGTATIGLGGILSPGNSPGTQTFDNLVWENGGTYLWEINADSLNGGSGTQGADPGWDWISVTNDWDISGITTNFNIDITSLTGANDAGLADGFDYSGKSYLDPFETFTILSFGTFDDTFDASLFSLNDSAFLNPKVGWSLEISGNDLVLNAVFVPEPSSTALLGLGGLALMLRRKRSAA